MSSALLFFFSIFFSCIYWGLLFTCKLNARRESVFYHYYRKKNCLKMNSKERVQSNKF